MKNIIYNIYIIYIKCNINNKMLRNYIFIRIKIDINNFENKKSIYNLSYNRKKNCNQFEFDNFNSVKEDSMYMPLVGY